MKYKVDPVTSRTYPLQETTLSGNWRSHWGAVSTSWEEKCNYGTFQSFVPFPTFV